MNRFRAWGLSAALAAAAGGPAAAADPPPAPPQPTTLFDKLFPPAEKAKPGPTAARRVPTVTAPLPPEVVAAALRAEQDAWDRRMAVCLKLRQAAIEADDDALLRQVDELERQAAALYAARTAVLGVPRAKAPLPEAAAAALDRQLGTGVAVTPLSAPAAPTPAVPSDAAARSAQAKGVRP
jgi:hypothetical protein